MLKRFKGKSVGFYLQAVAALVSLVLLGYYAVQSNIDACFDVVFCVFLSIGCLSAIVDVLFSIKFLDFLTPLSASSLGVAFGIMVKDMLPALSDVWNGVNFIGGNLVAYIIYTVLSFVCAILAITACFMGTKEMRTTK